MKMRQVAPAIALLVGLISASPASAMTVTCVNCSDKFLQMLERVTNIEQLESMWRTYKEEMMQTQQQIMMVQQNIQQYTNMVRNTIRLPFAIKNSVIRDFKRLAQLSKNLVTTVGDIEVLDGIYEAQYPDFNSAKRLVGQPNAKFTKKYKEYWSKWSERVDAATKATFKLSGSQLQEISDSAEFDSYIEGLLSTPEGRMQALEAANQLSSVQIQEIRKLRALLATQIQNQSMIEAKKEKDQQILRQDSEKFFAPTYGEACKKEAGPEPLGF
ncbi:P-type conjugative transfer protein TrbJ [Desulfovibrio sp. JC010]|uniref:P-type conjugative transfer protein TrbJ n=1 Tax=Desulfovibrio sp. JC010 TaxID=2593641 RepID=UPI0013D5ACBF|nr:P-type conjugative transfer protein TrbJ [Desulfovibrio sp. JC010]NDV28956.1 P-type conjugative transfer protein TrbJ [Desulfovibrio sp. JC010]